MVVLVSTFLDSGLALQAGMHPARSSLSESRSISRVLAITPSNFSDDLEFAKSAEQDSPFKPKPRWWIPFLPGAPKEWSSDSKLSGDDAASASKERSEVVVKGSLKKTGGRARKVVFTPEMARKLRKLMKSDGSYHDFMYHSAIASRMAIHEG